jgi:hypothetical protein
MKPLSSSYAPLAAALEAVYLNFDGPPPPIIEGCPCCITMRGVDVLLTSPLRDITGRAIWRYVSGAFLTVGGERDFRYLLPRILDISVNDPGNANDPEVVLGKLRLAGWNSWPPAERLVIETFINEWFEYSLAADVKRSDDGWMGGEAESVLCGAARAGLPLARWLSRLCDPVAGPVLADLAARYPNELSGFWEDEPEGMNQLASVLVQGHT